ncbi:unnamed protein product [Peronospora belbahrii]|uniref:Uncharacterized protein n=1 Tax=Peronospora belbahrii TaxID=622444 RepID=A0ABN8CRL4_9STRA|nr:unnamed protein product [Peronospora belbahrii]
MRTNSRQKILPVLIKNQHAQEAGYRDGTLPTTDEWNDIDAFIVPLQTRHLFKVHKASRCTYMTMVNDDILAKRDLRFCGSRLRITSSIVVYALRATRMKHPRLLICCSIKLSEVAFDDLTKY